MARYRKKPVEIEARRISADNATEIAAWCGGIIYDDTTPWDYDAGAVVLPDGKLAFVPSEAWGVIVPTLEGDHLGQWGDWMIQGVQGEFYPCKPDIFEATYEPV